MTSDVGPTFMVGQAIAPAVPRRWSVEHDGIRWLPRMIDKARMAHAGVLGAYLLGHSPVDKALLARLGLTTAAFSEIVRAASDDEAVMSALQARGFDEMRLRRWSDRFPKTYWMFLRMWDLDEGYEAPSWIERILLRAFHATQHGLMHAFRLVSPAP